MHDTTSFNTADAVQRSVWKFCAAKLEKFLLPFVLFEGEENREEKSGCIPQVFTKAQVWGF